MGQWEELPSVAELKHPRTKVFMGCLEFPMVWCSPGRGQMLRFTTLWNGIVLWNTNLNLKFPHPPNISHSHSLLFFLFSSVPFAIPLVLPLSPELGKFSRGMGIFTIYHTDFTPKHIRKIHSFSQLINGHYKASSW